MEGYSNNALAQAYQYPPSNHAVKRMPPPIDHSSRHNPQSSYTSSQSRTVRYAPPQHLTSQNPPISGGQAIALIQDAVSRAQEEEERLIGGSGAAEGGPMPGLTIELTHKNIQRLPEEIVDIIKDNVERLALHQNQICDFPGRFAECSRLRYLNLRSNLLREFPPPICQLSHLEILDMRGNKLKSLPEDISKMTSLNVFSIQKNRLESLPVCFGQMNALQVVKLDGNPISFPPREYITLEPGEVNERMNENERDTLITTKFKRFLKQHLMPEKLEVDSGGELSNHSNEGSVENFKPLKRVASGRFPVKVNTGGSDSAADARSPAVPPIPTGVSHNHYRGLSQHNAALRRPSLSTHGTNNERNRSNSESVLQATRNKRMGIVTRKTSDLGTVDETRSIRNSHLRGLSYSSAMHAKSSNKSQHEREISLLDRHPSIGQQRKGSYLLQATAATAPKPSLRPSGAMVNGAKNLFFALSEVNPVIVNLTILVKQSTGKESNLERVFYTAGAQFDALDRELYRFSTYADGKSEEDLRRADDNLQQACFTCASAYFHVAESLKEQSKAIIMNADERFVRSVMHRFFGSLVEISNACLSIAGPTVDEVTNLEAPSNGIQRDPALTPTRDNPIKSSRTRSDTIINHGHQNKPNIDIAPSRAPIPLKLAPLAGNEPPSSAEYLPLPFTPFGQASRSNAMQSIDETAASSMPTRTNVSQVVDFRMEEQLFEKIYLKLGRCCDLVASQLPSVNNWFSKVIDMCQKPDTPQDVKALWVKANQKCVLTRNTSDRLKHRLSMFKLDDPDPSFRHQKDFWQLCRSFLDAFVEMGMLVKEAKSHALLPGSLVTTLRPVQKAIKDVTHQIHHSPWKDLAEPSTPYLPHTPSLPVPPQSLQTSFTNASDSFGTMGLSAATPITSPPPSSATSTIENPASLMTGPLGPSSQVTMSTTTGASISSMSATAPVASKPLTGINIWERADSYLNSQGKNATSTGTEKYGASAGGRFHGRFGDSGNVR